ncbi:hypothetical protein G6011_03797 [Alternaria panax]|uniref:Uncharacterized protein n=1 Tax=Alternaria panax TaxID=48097 RepID=A0AAD4NT98_9PLEO|nr:hypothetical protein G6011_03797 [Alternaria panax]
MGRDTVETDRYKLEEVMMEGDESDEDDDIEVTNEDNEMEEHEMETWDKRGEASDEDLRGNDSGKHIGAGDSSGDDNLVEYLLEGVEEPLSAMLIGHQLWRDLVARRLIKIVRSRVPA